MEAGFQREVPRLVLAAPGRGVGLSSLLLGLLVCLRKSGISVGVGTLGTSLVQTTHFRRVAGRLAHTVDPSVLSRDAALDSLLRLSGGAELMLLECEAGLIDELPSGSSFGNAAELASDFGFPVVLVLDAAGYGESIEATLQGMISCAPNCQIVGIIANRIKNEAHGARIRKALSRVSNVTYLGGVAEAGKQLGDTNVGDDKEDNPSLLTRARLVALGEIVRAGVDVAALRALAAKAPPLPGELLSRVKQIGRCRVAVADDAAFHLTAQDNLDLMRRLGVEIVPFSPLADTRIPQGAGALYFPGGYTHLYAADLAANKMMLTAVREFAQSGGIIYAEGDAVAYAARRVSLANGENFELVGLLPGTAVSNIDEHGSDEIIPCEISAEKSNFLAAVGSKFRGVRQSSWLYRLDEPVLTCFHVRDVGAGGAPTLDGYCPAPHIMLTNSQAHWGQSLGGRNQPLVKSFVDAVGVR